MASAVETPTGERSSVGSRARARARVASGRSSVQSELDAVAASELADLCGVVNAAHGRMVEVVADVLDDDAWVAAGIVSPKHWLTWRTALTDASAQAVVNLACRRGELRATVAAMVSGRLSLGLAGLIARYVPAEFEDSVLELADVVTVNQMRRAVSKYRFDVEHPHETPIGPAAGDQNPVDPAAGAGAEHTDPAAGGADVQADGDTESDRGPAPTSAADQRPTAAADPESDPDHGSGSRGSGGVGGPESGTGSPFQATRPIVEHRDVTFGIDDDGHWYCKTRLPLDEGALVEQAYRTRREDLYRQAEAGLDPKDPRPRVSLADAVVSIAQSTLDAGEAQAPSSDRYLIHAHLTAAPDGANNLEHHLSAVLPDHLRHLHTCDGTIRPVLERDGTPCNIGRDQHIVPRRLRRLIEHRDGGCTVPGCDRRVGLQIHHIVHWEHDGPTDTDNLLALCRRHHRLHHLGFLQITGNADGPRHTAEGVRFADRWGRQLTPAATPTTLAPSESVATRAAEIGLQPQEFRHPLGERMDTNFIFFSRRAS